MSLRDKAGFELLAILKAHILEHGFNDALKTAPYSYVKTDGGMVLALIDAEGIITLYDLDILREKSMTFEALTRLVLPHDKEAQEQELLQRCKLLQQLGTALNNHYRGWMQIVEDDKGWIAEMQADIEADEKRQQDYEEMMDIILGCVEDVV